MAQHSVILIFLFKFSLFNLFYLLIKELALPNSVEIEEFSLDTNTKNEVSD